MDILKDKRVKEIKKNNNSIYLIDVKKDISDIIGIDVEWAYYTNPELIIYDIFPLDFYNNDLNRVIDFIKTTLDSLDNNKFSMDNSDVIVKFKNGNIVKFWNSEWGGMIKRATPSDDVFNEDIENWYQI